MHNFRKLETTFSQTNTFHDRTLTIPAEVDCFEAMKLMTSGGTEHTPLDRHRTTVTPPTTGLAGARLEDTSSRRDRVVSGEGPTIAREAGQSAGPEARSDWRWRIMAMMWRSAWPVAQDLEERPTTKHGHRNTTPRQGAQGCRETRLVRPSVNKHVHAIVCPNCHGTMRHKPAPDCSL